MIRRVETEQVDPVYDVTNMPWHDPPTPNFKNVGTNELGEERADVLLMTATPIELKQVLWVLRPLSPNKKICKIHSGHETYYLGQFGSHRTVVTMCAAGSVGPDAAGQTARSAIELWKPVALVMVGIAFGADKKKHRPADVLVATKIIRYEGQRVGKKIIHRDTIPPTGLILSGRFKNALGWRFERPDKSQVIVHHGGGSIW